MDYDTLGLLHELLLNACKEGDLSAAKDAVADGALPRWHGDEAFTVACSNGSKEVAIWLHEDHGASVDAWGGEPLYDACSNGDTEMVQWLIGAGASYIGVVSYFKLACGSGTPELAIYLSENFENCDQSTILEGIELAESQGLMSTADTLRNYYFA